MDHKPAGGSYGQQGMSPAAQRNRLRKDQHYAPGGEAGESGPDPYGEGGFAGGGAGQSGYGGENGMLEPSQRHEKQVSEHDRRSGGTPSKSSR